jgi:NADPH-dependent stearoyl-CoA 9-desaturase
MNTTPHPSLDDALPAAAAQAAPVAASAARKRSRALSLEEQERFCAEIDALRLSTLHSLGERDARYIRRVVLAMRSLELLGRAMLVVGCFLPEAWMFSVWLTGAVVLGIAKIIDNMEVGHNVIHGQYDWMNDPSLSGKSYEWDIVGTSEYWRRTHNYRHHTYTNVHGMDEDLGYGLLRLFPEQRWSPFFLAQPFIAIIFALLFQWGVAIQELRLGRYFMGRMSKQELADLFRPVKGKMRNQLLKDYLFVPLLAGPFFLWVVAGNLIANGIRNVWTYTVIFCGHFTAEVETFPKSVLRDETRAQWYLRQIAGSSNLTGGWLMNFLTGNLSHQIEHHLFPDIPANRYAEIAPVVRDICKRYGQHYNTGSMVTQFAQVIWRIVRHSFPSSPAKPPRQAQAGA